jgi:signal transduction histidine kinase
MKKDTFLLLILFLTIEISLFGIHYLYLLQNGFNNSNYIVAFLILFLPSAVIGYIFLYIAFESIYSKQKNLEHLVREILHEINLPISTIYANVALLEKSCTDQKSSKRLKRIKNSTKRLKKLYKELSYYIKKEISLIEKEEFNLKELILEEVEHFKSLGFDRFKLNLEDTKLFLDKVGLEQVIDNILENSLKYSKENIEIELKDKTLKIKDKGVGISENEMLKIYQRYYQSDSSKTGEGIGLAIVKRYCDENSLRLSIFSKKGEGTTVEIRF